MKSFLMITTSIAMSLMLALSVFLSGVVSSDNKPISITAVNVISRPEANKSGWYAPSTPGVFFVLIIGNDYRPGVGGKRADGIHLVGINTNEKQASIINFPRDTNVSIPGHGRNKINAANAYGGSALTTQTVEQLVGVSVSYVLEVDFAGFTGVVNDLGGLDVPVEKPMHDKNSGTHFNPGIVRMDGHDALAFARDRYSFSNGDISRTHNQAVLLIAALNELRKNKKSITSKFESASFIAKNVALTNLNLKSLYMLIELANTVYPDDVQNITVPWAGSNTLAPRAQDLFTDLRDNGIVDTYVP